MRRTSALDRERCKELIASRSANELVAAPFRRQLQAALVELASTRAALDRAHAALARAHAALARADRDYQRIVPAGDALLEHTRAHSSACVCPMCRATRGYREIIAARVAEYRAKSGTGT